MPIRHRAVFAAFATAAVMALTGCGSGAEGDGAADPPASAAPSGSLGAPERLPEGWAWTAGTEVPSVSAEPKLPTTITDATGAEIAIDDASKVIVAGDDVAAILGGLGLADLVYAAPSDSTSEVGMQAPQKFDFSQQTGSEGLLAVKGTLFIGNNIKRHGQVAGQFNAAGIDAVVLDDQQSVPDKIRDIGSYLGVGDAAEELASDVEDQLADAAKAASAADLSETKILQVTATGAGGADAVIGSGTAGADIVQALGAKSVGVEAGLRGYSVKFSNEGLLDAAPDVILLGDADLEKWDGLAGFTAAFPTLLDTPAGQAGRIVVMPTEQIKVSGPATGAGALALAEQLATLVD